MDQLLKKLREWAAALDRLLQPAPVPVPVPVPVRNRRPQSGDDRR